MLDLRNLRFILEKENIAKVAKDTDIHVNTLFRIRDGVNDNPRIKTIEKLSNYFVLEEK